MEDLIKHSQIVLTQDLSYIPIRITPAHQLNCQVAGLCVGREVGGLPLLNVFEGPRLQIRIGREPCTHEIEVVIRVVAAKADVIHAHQFNDVVHVIHELPNGWLVFRDKDTDERHADNAAACGHSLDLLVRQVSRVAA